MIRVLIADDHELMRSGLREMLDAQEDIEATRRLVAHGGAPKILILTTFDLDEYVWKALRAGAAGFMLKDAAPRQLVEAVRAVAGGEALLAPAITQRMVERFMRVSPGSAAAQRERFAELTERGLQVLELVARGRSNAEIAGELYLSTATVKTHVTRILAKLDLRDRVHAVVLAYESGLVEPGAAG